jgi:phage host-nuclease inhibitor protein Gam
MEGPSPDAIIDPETGEVLNPEDFGVNKDFVIDSRERCEWYIDKVRTVAFKQAELKKNYEAMKKQLDNELHSLEYLFQNQFIHEIKKHIQKGKKSLTTLFGTVAFRKCKPNVEVCEKEAIDKKYWTEETKIVEKLNKEALLAAFAAGESPDGVTYIPERDSLSIK